MSQDDKKEADIFKVNAAPSRIILIIIAVHIAFSMISNLIIFKEGYFNLIPILSNGWINETLTVI